VVKKLNTILFFLALVVAAIFCAHAKAGAGTDNASYVVFDAASGANTIPIAMSTAGVITGRFYTEGVPGIHGFLRTGRGAIVEFDAPGSTLTFPNAINAAGVISGFYLDSTYLFHGFVRRSDGGFNTFDVPGSDFTYPNSINASGAITGVYGSGYGFLRNARGQFVTFNASSSEGTTPLEIQDDGTILGYYYDTNGVGHGFLRSASGSFTTFDPPGGLSVIPNNSYGPEALSINLGGVITGGYVEASSGNTRGFILNRDDSFTTFDGANYPPCCIWTFPFAISASGSVVGLIIDGNGVTRGFVRTADGTSTIFDAPNAGIGYGQGTFPTAITPDGRMMMGLDVDTNGVNHGFIRLTQPGLPSVVSR
jgi:hypothetical protein